MVATQHCYFADMAYETKCVELHAPISKVAMLGCCHDKEQFQYVSEQFHINAQRNK